MSNEEIKTLSKLKSDTSNNPFFKYTLDTANHIIDNINLSLIPSISTIIGKKTEDLQKQIKVIDSMVNVDIPAITDSNDVDSINNVVYSPMHPDQALGL